MAIPYVFVSSTWYDLRYVRENLKFLIKSLGYHPILSEEGEVYFDPTMHVAEAAVAEVGNCQMLVLIIGGRLGAEMPSGDESVTNAEYSEAVRKRIPIFALVEQAVLSDFAVYEANASNDPEAAARILYPSVDSPRIFEFIRQVRGQAINNALVAFSDFSDIESYLKSQWAAMMHSYLTGASEQRRVADTLAALTDMNQRIEQLSKQNSEVSRGRTGASSSRTL